MPGSKPDHRCRRAIAGLLAFALVAGLLLAGCVGPGGVGTVKDGGDLLFWVGNAPPGFHHCIPAEEMVRSNQVPPNNPGEFSEKALGGFTYLFGAGNAPQRAWAESLALEPDVTCDPDAGWVTLLQVYEWEDEADQARGVDEVVRLSGGRLCATNFILERDRFIVILIPTRHDDPEQMAQNTNATRLVLDAFEARHAGFDDPCPAS